MLLARADEPAAETHFPELDAFDRIRTLLTATGLRPTPSVYELFWRYIEDKNHELSRALDFALAMKTLDARMAASLHGVHCAKWHDD